jgi:hypothetical protein
MGLSKLRPHTFCIFIAFILLPSFIFVKSNACIDISHGDTYLVFLRWEVVTVLLIYLSIYALFCRVYKNLVSSDLLTRSHVFFTGLVCVLISYLSLPEGLLLHADSPLVIMMLFSLIVFILNMGRIILKKA